MSVEAIEMNRMMMYGPEKNGTREFYGLRLTIDICGKDDDEVLVPSMDLLKSIINDPGSTFSSVREREDAYEYVSE